jgi:hypothetical protein
MRVKSVSHVRGKTEIWGFVNRALRRIFGSKRNEVTAGWGKLYNEEFHNLNSSPILLG